MKKSAQITYWITTVWLALGMVATGIAQILLMPGQGGADMIARLGYPEYMLTILGIWKILGVVAILAPRYPLVKEWAYAGFFFLLSGAIYSHIAISDPWVETLPALLLLVLTIVSWYFRPASRRILVAR